MARGKKTGVEGLDKARLTEMGKKHLWLGFGRDESWFDEEGAIAASGEGSYFIDVEGNRYLDALGGQGALSLGYNHPAVMEALFEQIGKLCANPGGMPASVPAILLAGKLASMPPQGLTKTFFTLSGSDANDTAIKMARQYFKLKGKGSKYKVIARRGGYHGSTLGTTAASGYTFRRRYFEPLPQGFIHIERPYCYRCPWKMTYPECGIECANAFRQAVEFEDPSTVACFLGELTIAGGGMLPPPPEYIQRIRQICDEYDILMIADEVATGFGRTGTWFDCQNYGIVPDMMTVGKAISGGYVTVAAVRVKGEIAEAFSGSFEKNFQHGFTFAGNSLGCAAGLATIKAMEDMEVVEQVAAKGALTQAGLEKVRQSSNIVGDIRSKGLMLGVELVRNVATKEPFPDQDAIKHTIFSVGRKNGGSFYGFGSTILLMPPLIITQEEIGLLIDIVGKVVREVEAQFEG